MMRLFKASELRPGMIIETYSGNYHSVEKTGDEPDWTFDKFNVTGWKHVQFSNGEVYTFKPDANYDFPQWNVIHVPLTTEEKQRLIEAAE